MYKSDFNRRVIRGIIPISLSSATDASCRSMGLTAVICSITLLWDFHGNCLVTFIGHNDSATSVSFSPTIETISIALKDPTAKLRDLLNNSLVELSGDRGNLHKGEVDCLKLTSQIVSVCLSRDGKFLITGDVEGKERFLPIESLDELLANARECLSENV